MKWWSQSLLLCGKWRMERHKPPDIIKSITNLKSTWENEGSKNVRFCSSIFITNLRKMSPNINVKSTTYLHTNLTSEQSNWVPKLQRLSVQQIFHLSKKKHCSNWMERGRVPKEQSNSVGKLRRIEDWGFELWTKLLQQVDGKRMSAKWAKHMCWNAARKT